jgi:signal transduction histidine kinase
MQRHLGIRGKILAVLALPALVLVGASGAVSMSARAEVERAQQVRAVSASSERFGAFVGTLQAERLASVQAVSGDAAARAGLAARRAATDVTRMAVVRKLAGWPAAGPGSRVRAGADAVIAGADRLPALREQVDAALAGTGGTGTELDALARKYGEIVDAVADLPATVASTLDDRRTAAGLEAASWLGRAGEALSREQLAGVRLLVATTAGTGSRSGGGSPVREMPLAAEVATADGLRVTALARFQAVADSDQRAALHQVQPAPDGATPTGNGATPTVDALADQLLGRSPNGLAAVDLGTWQQVTSLQAAGLRQVGVKVATGTEAASAQAVDDARLRVELTLAGAVLLVGLSVLLALIQSRRIAAPLRQLTAVATGLAADLPALAAQAQAGNVVPDEPAAAVRGRDEVGRLAEAFGDVHATTLVVAREQGALRATVSDMFVNVARRNQALLSRLLAFIDRLERHEEDPNVLDNLFRLDHLATRMRRNAESLLVLAGADSGRRLRAPMQLADVLRTAVGEVEHFDRVRLDLSLDPPIVGHLALPTAHLLAELIENATNFSDPGSPVWITGSLEGAGLRLIIWDQGMGLPPEELARVNARLADPGTVDTMNSKRLGFFVVGRLAARLDSRVRLESGAQGGTQAVVELSPALFVPGSLVAQPEHGAPAGTAAGLPDLDLAEEARAPVADVVPPAGGAGPVVAMTAVADNGVEPPPNWQALLHQRHDEIAHGSIADPLFPAGWLTPDAWADAPPPVPGEETKLAPRQSTRSFHASASASLLWKPEDEAVQAPSAPTAGSPTSDGPGMGDEGGIVRGTGLVGGPPAPAAPTALPPRLPRRTPPLPPFPGTEQSATLPSRTPSSLPGPAGLSPELAVGLPVPFPDAPVGSVPPDAAVAESASEDSAVVEPAVVEPAVVEPVSAGEVPAPGACQATVPQGGAMRDILPRHGLRLGLRLGRRSRVRSESAKSGSAKSGSAKSGVTGPAPTGSGSVPAGDLRSSPALAGGTPAGSDPGLDHAKHPARGVSAGNVTPWLGGTSGGPTGEPDQAAGLGSTSEVASALGPARPGPAGLGRTPSGAWPSTFPGVPSGGPSGTADQSTAQGCGPAGADEASEAGEAETSRPWAMAGVEHTDEERLRHAIASEALSELSQLSSYRPDKVSAAPASRLVRRTPASESVSASSPVAAADAAHAGGTAAEAGTSTDAAAVPAAATGAAVQVDGWARAEAGAVPSSTVDAVPVRAGRSPRSRDADQLRRMLSGFQTGFRRGRGLSDGGKLTTCDGDERRTS